MLPAVLTLVLLPLFIYLGIWQLERADEKRRLFSEFRERQSGEVLLLHEQAGPVSAEHDLWRPARARGRFDEDRRVLLDNRIMQGRVGYYVYTPFKIAGVETPVLVNRGWVAAGAYRSDVPDLERIEGAVVIEGILTRPPSVGIKLGEAGPEKLAGNFIRVQDIDLAELGRVLGVPLQPLILRLSKESAHGYRREWPVPGSGVSKHHGYAFQWFAFAAVLLVLFIVLNIKKHNSSDAGPE